MEKNYIFGYGSLVDGEQLKRFLGRKQFLADDITYCRLKNYRRTWNVAMNSRLDIPGYKYYIDLETGHRFQGYVTFLNIRPATEHSIQGILFKVSPTELKLIDRRERNYQRIDITAQLDFNLSSHSRAWVYIGLAEARERFQTGYRSQQAVIAHSYYDLVHQAFKNLDSDALADYLATTDEPIVPLQKLKMQKIPDKRRH